MPHLITQNFHDLNGVNDPNCADALLAARLRISGEITPAVLPPDAAALAPGSTEHPCHGAGPASPRGRRQGRGHWEYLEEQALPDPAANRFPRGVGQPDRPAQVR